MKITGLDQVGDFYENIRLTGIEKKADICSLFQAVADIIEEPGKCLYTDGCSHWVFSYDSLDWFITLMDDYLLCEQINGRASAGLVSMAYHLIASIGCELSIDGSRLESMWITLKNGAQIRLH